jgi:hypothetical protein
MARVTLPDGCYGLDLQDGTKYSGKPGTSIEVQEKHKRAIDKSFYGQGRSIISGEGHTIRTKRTKQCPECKRLWQVWTVECHKCNIPTIEVD